MSSQEFEIFQQSTEIKVGDKLVELIQNSKNDNARWIDQKVTFDNLHVIALAVDLSVPDDSEFTRFTIQESRVLGDVVRREYGKPSLDDEHGQNEYDKFIAQPLNTLAFAGILASEKRGRRFYRVRDREMLPIHCSE
nr:Uncharacterised protein [Streptococcus thermophilus]